MEAVQVCLVKVRDKTNARRFPQLLFASPTEPSFSFSAFFFYFLKFIFLQSCQSVDFLAAAARDVLRSVCENGSVFRVYSAFLSAIPAV